MGTIPLPVVPHFQQLHALIQSKWQREGIVTEMAVAHFHATTAFILLLLLLLIIHDVMAFVVRPSQTGAQPEIGELDVPVFVDQNVVRLDVSKGR